MRKLLILTITISILAVAPATAGTSGVAVKDDVFSPKTVSIDKGDSVKWTWKGKRFHNVKGPGFASKTQKTGTYTRRFAKAGSFKVVCTLHAGMVMRVKVD